MLVESLSGVRGIFGRDLTEDIVRRYAKAFAKNIKAKGGTGIVIGYDTRPSSQTMCEWMMEEFLREDIADVYNCKVASTAAMHIAVEIFKTHGGVMITASHNEPEWNGMKFMRPDGAMLLPDEAEQLRLATIGLVIKNRPVDLSKVMDVSRRLTQEYLLLLLRTVGEKAKQKLAEMQMHIYIDTNGGAGYLYAKEFLNRLNIQTTCKGEEPGVFWRAVEPKSESLAPIVDFLDIEKADFAVAFDCDADRMEFVLPKTAAFVKQFSPFVSGQYVLGLVTKAVLAGLPKHTKKPTVVINCATSQLVTEVVGAHDALVEEVDVGEINVVKRMRELSSPVGGEGSSSGGIIPPMAGRDGLLTLAVILRYLAESGKSIDEALLDLPRYVTLQEKVAVDPGKAGAIREKLIDTMRHRCKDVVVFGIDGGVKCVPAEKQFITFRLSKTEAGVYRIIVDAKEEKDTKALLAEAKDTLAKLSK